MDAMFGNGGWRVVRRRGIKQGEEVRGIDNARTSGHTDTVSLSDAIALAPPPRIWPNIFFLVTHHYFLQRSPRTGTSSPCWVRLIWRMRTMGPGAFTSVIFAYDRNGGPREGESAVRDGVRAFLWFGSRCRQFQQGL